MPHRPYLLRKPFQSLVASCLMVALSAVCIAESPGRGNFDTREAFDTIDSLRDPAYIYTDNGEGRVAWGVAYLMNAYMSMYEATGDTVYLDRLIWTADTTLAHRDSEVGAVDYLGRSLPGWSSGHHYSIGEVELNDANGEPTLYLKTSFTGRNNAIVVTVTPGEAAGTFDLRLMRPEQYGGMEDFIENLTMDRDSPRYAVTVLRESTWANPMGRARLMVEDLGSSSSGADRNPVPVEAGLVVERYHWPVHQGQATMPMVHFARTVLEDPELQKNPMYMNRAKRYIKAAEEIVEIMEENWRENDEGEGWYVIERGAPVWIDGLDEPHNHYLALGRTMIHLAAVSDDPRWADRAEKMARTFHNDMTVVERTGGYTWPYWWSKGFAHHGWKPEDDVSDNTPGLAGRPTSEDFSHASIDVHFAYLCYKDGIIFDKQDMERIARTFVYHIIDEDEDGKLTFRNYVDPDQDGGKGRYDLLGPHWIHYARFDRRVYDAMIEIREDVEWTGRIMHQLMSGNLNQVKDELGPVLD